MDNDFFRKIVTIVILSVLIILTFFVLKPILLSIIVGVILAVIFATPYDFLAKKTKLKNLSAFLICLFLILMIILPVWFLTPIFIKQSFEVFINSQQLDFVTPLKNFFPSLFASEQFSAEIASIMQSFVVNAVNSLVNSFSNLILNFPSLFLQLLIVFATFFFVLRDKEELVSYIRSLMPFTKDVEDKLFKSSRDLTLSVVYGQIVTGTIQGLVAGAGFFIFGVPNALLLSLLAIFAGIMPIIGTTIVWLPVVVYLLIAGNNVPALGVGFFGLIATGIDNFIRPALVSKKTRIHPLLVLIGMIGGLFLFGVLGFILGPLIIAYVLIVVEIYRGKEIKGFLSVNKT